jgi:hypothetical protein
MSDLVEQDLREEEPRWFRAYSIVMGLFALEVLLLYFFTVRFS